MLLSRIVLPSDSSPEPEDIFSSALATIFTDDTNNSHGTPGSSITYKSPRFGDIELRIPVHPDEEQGRKLFAHYLWNAAVIAADAIESASQTKSSGAPQVDAETLTQWDQRYWDLRNKAVLELGAGTALPSLLAALSGARSCTITDHPSSPALTTGAIECNIRANLYRKPDDVAPSEAVRSRTSTTVEVAGYTWGTDTFYSTTNYGKPISVHEAKFDRIIVADCLWMPSQHINLIKTILAFLQSTDPTTPHPQSPSSSALVVAGFHTGRRIVSNFFSLATESPSSTLSQPDAEDTTKTDEDELGEDEMQHVGKLKIENIFEIDVDGNKREWKWWNRPGEGKFEAKRWCVVAVLVRRDER